MSDASAIAEGPSTAPPSSQLKNEVERVAGLLTSDGHFINEIVTRPHPLLTMIVREELAVIFAPAAVWDRGRELLKPHAHRFAESSALLVLLGRPHAADLDHALARGITSILP